MTNLNPSADKTPNIDYVKTLFSALAAALGARNGDMAVAVLNLLADEIGKDQVRTIVNDLITIGLRRMTEQANATTGGA
ncbi:hypothetical protein ACFFX1_11870 [Dactylosporangium sucinum]|uniref:Uncharacterized protein n=1 Tax=Dactylosporangium sucinum TaxID=1424081 RepID=A0A917WTM7_9ACTN|nr:hypothetical protein [Dactylosporangium sucinum]GGM27681.1 hypothetical protein GCM10007977_031160 [Dactylosporangium sucinum]